MSVNITGPALSSLLFEHCNADGDRVCICCSLSLLHCRCVIDWL